MIENGDMEKPLIRTIGHSTRPVDALTEMLKAHGITRLIDVRTIPKSRYNPQYNREALERSLRDAGIGYEHMKALGGLRHPRKDSPNTAWRNESFRGYADYMQTPEFESALNVLATAAAHQALAIMCAEAVPWRCHRIADFGCSGGAWLPRGAHHERDQIGPAHHDVLCESGRERGYVSCRRTGTIVLESGLLGEVISRC